MSQRDELYSALSKADAAGDTEGAKQLADYIRALPPEHPAEHTNPGGSGMPYGPVTEMSGPKRYAAGLGMNMTNIARGLGNMVGLVSDQDIKDARELDRQLAETPGGAAGDLTGDIITNLPLTMGATMGVSRLGKVGAMIAGNPIARGALEGAVQGGVTAQPGQRLKGAGFGAVAGATLPALVGGGRAVATGVGATPEARALMAQGVDLTPGQMNPKGVANQLESDWQSVPFIGPRIQAARKQAENQYKQALIRESAAPNSQIANNSDLSAMLDDAYKSFDTEYDKVKGFPLVLQKGKPVIVNQGSNTPLANAFSQIVSNKGVLASDQTRSTVGGWLDNQLTKPIKESGDLLSVRSQIRAQIRSIKGGTQDDLATRELLALAEQAVTHSLESQLPPDAMQLLKAADAQYGKYKIVENAVGKGGDKEFTPFQASKAVREATDKSAYARGGGRLRDLTAAGASTFSDTPITGARMASIGIPLAAMSAKPMIAIPAALGIAAGALTQSGRQAAAGNTALQKIMQSLDQGATTRISQSNRERIAELLSRGNVAALGKWDGTSGGASP